MRHVTPFREETQSKLSQLSDTSETLERWLKVQMLWCSLESVFTGGDIAKQMPLEAKKFLKVDKDWAKNMAKAEETKNVVSCCSNELLKNTLPIMYTELQKCQKKSRRLLGAEEK
jgi:dynein heavy chain